MHNPPSILLLLQVASEDIEVSFEALAEAGFVVKKL